MRAFVPTVLRSDFILPNLTHRVQDTFDLKLAETKKKSVGLRTYVPLISSLAGSKSRHLQSSAAVSTWWTGALQMQEDHCQQKFNCTSRNGLKSLLA